MFHPEIEKLVEECWNIFESDIEKGRQLCVESFRLSEELSDPIGLAFSLRNSGMIHQVTGSFQEAIADLERSLRIFIAEGYKPGEASARNCLANTYWRINDLQKSLGYHLENLSLRRDLGNLEGEAATLNNIGLNYFDLGYYDSALEYFAEAKNLFERVGSKEGLGMAFNNISDIYEILGDNAKALEYQLQSLQFKKEAGKKLGEVSTLVNIGNTFRRMGQCHSAMEYLQLALSLANELGSNPSVALCIINLGELHAAQKEYEQALEYHLKAMSMFEDMGEHYNKIEAMIGAGKDLISMNRPLEAVDQINKALEEADESQTSDLQYQANLHLANAYECAENFDLALKYLKTCFKFRETMFGADEERKIKNTLIKIEVEQAKRESEIYRVKNEELHQANEKITQLFEALQETSRELERQSLEDALTRVFNRRYLNRQLDYEFERSQRFNRALSVAMLDIDNFKTVNDRFGHQVGDETLQHFAAIIKENIRSADTVGRYGGEEFMVIFVESDSQAAAEICERLRISIYSYSWHTINPDLAITVSIGLSSMPAKSALDLTERADQNLYMAKKNGKNQVYATSS